MQNGGHADLYAVAKTHGLNARMLLHVTRKDRHGVGVVEEPCIGADLFHVTCKVLENVDGSHTAHDTADAQGIGDGLTETVLLGDLKVNDGAGVVQTDLDSIHHEIRAAQSVLALFRAKILLDGSSALVDGVVHSGDEEIRLLQSCGINVVQCDLHVMECGTQHGVTQNVF